MLVHSSLVVPFLVLIVIAVLIHPPVLIPDNLHRWLARSTPKLHITSLPASLPVVAHQAHSIAHRQQPAQAQAFHSPASPSASTPLRNFRALQPSPKFYENPSLSAPGSPTPSSHALRHTPVHREGLSSFASRSANHRSLDKGSSSRSRIHSQVLSDSDSDSDEALTVPEFPSPEKHVTASDNPGGRLSTAHRHKHYHSALLFALEEALRSPYSFTPDLVEEEARLTEPYGIQIPLPENPHTSVSVAVPEAKPVFRAHRRVKSQPLVPPSASRSAFIRQTPKPPTAVETMSSRHKTTVSSSTAPAVSAFAAAAGIKSPTQIMKERQDRERRRAEQKEQDSIMRDQEKRRPGPSSQAPPNSSGSGKRQSTSQSKSSFPHAFERWEALSAQWEGVTRHWIRRLEMNGTMLETDPLSKTLSRQVTDLSAAGANLFHAVVELQRLRASSERKFQRWFFETRGELERIQEEKAQLEAALRDEQNARREKAVQAQNTETVNILQRQLAEMKKELTISKEEARRAWEELGRREQEERERTFSLQNGQPTIVGGVQVVPMSAGNSRRGHMSQAQAQQQQQQHEQVTGSYTPPHQPPATTAAANPEYSVEADSHYHSGYVLDAAGNRLLDSRGRPIPYETSGSPLSHPDMDDYNLPSSSRTHQDSSQSQQQYQAMTSATMGSSSAMMQPSASPASSSAPQTSTSQSVSAADNPYSGASWDIPTTHHHLTRLSDVLEEEESRTTASQISRILLGRLDNILWQLDTFFALHAILHQIIAYKLLVEAVLVTSNLILVGWPKAGRIRCQNLVSQHDLICFLIQSKLKLGVGNDDAALKRILCSGRVQRQSQLLDALGVLFAPDQCSNLAGVDVLVLLALLGLGGGRKQRLRKLLALLHPSRHGNAVHRAFGLVLGPCTTANVAAHNGLNREDLQAAHCHAAV
ncbi:hypothetical protein CFIMG_004502RA [Ceratocystis fimbriata CBS 114723]|uniref:Uncharacterized protein n=1 Tax=Ceratocystis fimbriata CBS 114723 TaxID=1035309 RepID=A0A2C5WXJ8_9PEZI|nr:hypothetical protein CFIMG_004502RA [Ceratocystis fimbriata CBS 114723]